MSNLLIKSGSSVNGKLVKELKRLWLVKVSQNGLMINFDNQPNKYPNWIPPFGYLMLSIDP